MVTLFICFLLVIARIAFINGTSISLQGYLNRAIAGANAGDFNSAQSTLEDALKEHPGSIDALQLLGVVNFQIGDHISAISLLGKALDMDNYQNLGIVANYIEVLRSSGNLPRASEIGHRALANIGKSRFKDCSIIYYNLGVVEMNLNRSGVAMDMFANAVQHNPSLIKAWHYYGELMLKINPEAGERLLRQAITHVPSDHTLHFMLGTAYQMQHKLVEALDSYLHAEQLNGEAYNLKGNIAATLQSLGRAEEALVYYQRALPHATGDAGLYNNYGALLGIMGKHEEEVHWLTEALNINPHLGPALVNLAGHYQDEGDLPQARELIRRAALPEAVYSNEGTRTPGILFRIRDALMLSPVAHSWAQMYEERAHIMHALTAILKESEDTMAPPTAAAVEKVKVDTSLDHIHFYVSYHGLNDRALQDLVTQVYRRYLRLEHYSPHVDPQSSFPAWIPIGKGAAEDPRSGAQSSSFAWKRAADPSALVNKRRARVGFMSKFFGIFEPHGMLLDGVMKYLPRDRFEVIALPVARGDGKPLSPTVQAASDEVVVVSLNYEHAQAMLQDLRLDILVFADTVSEPMNHFLAHSRLAPIQVRFCLFAAPRC